MGKQNQFKVINNLNYDESKVIDLSKIKYQNQEYNFKDKTKDNIFNNYIMEYIKQGFKINKLDEILVLDVDYQISSQGLNGKKININDNELQKFMEKIKENKGAELKITIYALDNSLKIIGSGSYKLINNPTSENAPNTNQMKSPPTEGIIPSTPKDTHYILIIPMEIMGMGMERIIIQINQKNQTNYQSLTNPMKIMKMVEKNF